LAKVTTDNSGRFNFATCSFGYHQLQISNNGNQPYIVPLPLPGVNVSVFIQILKVATADKRLIAADKKTRGATQAFSVCRDYNGDWLVFNGGLMTGGVLSYMSAPNMVTLNVYTRQSSNPLFKYAVIVDLRSNPFYAMPLSGQYHFTDASGDEYDLRAYWPYLHSVSYNSSAPDIVKVGISAILRSNNYWPNAPNCR
jgi:hypothetical protein